MFLNGVKLFIFDFSYCLFVIRMAVVDLIGELTGNLCMMDVDSRSEEIILLCSWRCRYLDKFSSSSIEISTVEGLSFNLR